MRSVPTVRTVPGSTVGPGTVASDAGFVRRSTTFSDVALSRSVITAAIGVCLAAAVTSTAFAIPAVATGAASETSDVEVLHGADAVEHLESSDTLDEVAAEAGLLPVDLVAELTGDPSLFITDTGLVGYADLAPPGSPSPERESKTHAAAPLTVGVQRLDSIPGAARTIYLDFDGHENTVSPWASPESPVTSEPSGVSEAKVYEVWQRVSEDYLPFDVNVTTIDPGVEALRKTSASDSVYGVRVVISPTYVGVYGPGTLGVAIVGSFDASVDQPAFVFAGAATSTKQIAETASHEAGHTLGLHHDGLNSTAYYDGHGDWAPIMGRPLSKTVTQWSKGEYAGANNHEDELARIASYVGYRADDHGDTACTGTVVASSSATTGFIGRTGDLDVFVVDVGAGPLSVQLQPPSGAGAWTNLLAEITVRDKFGVVVATGTPTLPSSWTASASADVAPGGYVVEVAPIGWKTADDGFTTYGSLGAYELLVTGAPATSPPVGHCRSTFTPITPTRLVDSRNGIGASGRIGAGRQVRVQVTDGGTIPNDATAAVFSIVAVGPSAQGYLTAHPCSASVPETSTLNYVAGQTVANSTIAALSSAGQLCVWTNAETDILVDITGWLGPTGTSRMTTLGPTRVVDTRSGLGGGRVPSGGTMAVDFNGIVAPGSTGVALNVTAVNASSAAFLTVYPCSSALPVTSTINYAAAEARPNNTIVGLSGGRVCIYSYASTDILVDLVGAFGPTGLAYRPTAPVRVLDTRGGPPLPAGGAISYNVAASALGEAAPGAAFVNLTAADHVVPGYVTTYDCVVRRDTSTLNQRVGQVAANGAIVPLVGTESCAWMYGGGHLIVDLNGWWVP